MKAKPATIDEYLAGVSPEKRAVLQKLRKQIRLAAPKAEECISYAMPAFRETGMLVGFAAGVNRCSFYPWNGSTVKKFKDELADYETSKGAIRFRVDDPLPAALVRRIVKSRLAENKAKAKRKAT